MKVCCQKGWGRLSKKRRSTIQADIKRENRMHLFTVMIKTLVPSYFCFQFFGPMAEKNKQEFFFMKSHTLGSTIARRKIMRSRQINWQKGGWVKFLKNNKHSQNFINPYYIRITW